MFYIFFKTNKVGREKTGTIEVPRFKNIFSRTTMGTRAVYSSALIYITKINFIIVNLILIN
jgi:hypothetical protein